MDKRAILKILKSHLSDKGRNIKLPSKLDLNIKSGVLYILVVEDEVVKNMQSDSAAFEGWALVIKRWMPEVEKVIIEWQEPKVKQTYPGNGDWQHYQRFLYRVQKFIKAYSWAHIHSSCTPFMADLEVKPGGTYVLNVPSEERSRAYGASVSIRSGERELETYIVSNPTVSADLKQELKLNHLDNQLPVGLFKGVKSNATKIFTGGGSAIDIWGLSNDGGCHLFELKNDKNRKVGALSEMLFYSFVIKDVQNQVFRFDNLKHPGLSELSKTNLLKCHLLAPNYHPLVDVKVIELMNNSSSGINYGRVQISNSLNFKVII